MSIKTVTKAELSKMAGDLVEPVVVDLKQQVSSLTAQMRGLMQQLNEMKLGRESDRQAREALARKVDAQVRSILDLIAKFEDDHK